MAKSLQRLSSDVSSISSAVKDSRATLSEFLKEQAYGVVSTEIPNVDGSGNPLALSSIYFEEDMKGKMLRYSKVVLTFPDGSNPLIISNDMGNQPVDGSESRFFVRDSGIGAEIFPGITYPVGSLILGLDYEANSINAAAGDEDQTQEIQYNYGGKLASSGLPANEGGAPLVASFYYDRITGLVHAEGFAGKNIIGDSGSSNGDIGTGGDIIYTGSGTTVAGYIYYLNSSNTWITAQPSTTSTALGLLAVALGSSPSTDGMLLRGTVTISYLSGSPQIGNVAYLGGSAYFSGIADVVAPSSSGNVVRVVGYSLTTSGTSSKIWFNPSDDWVVVA